MRTNPPRWRTHPRVHRDRHLCSRTVRPVAWKKRKKERWDSSDQPFFSSFFSLAWRGSPPPLFLPPLNSFFCGFAFVKSPNGTEFSCPLPFSLSLSVFAKSNSYNPRHGKLSPRFGRIPRLAKNEIFFGDSIIRFPRSVTRRHAQLRFRSRFSTRGAIGLLAAARDFSANAILPYSAR